MIQALLRACFMSLSQKERECDSVLTHLRSFTIIESEPLRCSLCLASSSSSDRQRDVTQHDVQKQTC